MRKIEQLLSNEELTRIIESSRELMGIKDQESINVDFGNFKIYPIMFQVTEKRYL